VILVDTSAWVEFDRGTDSPVGERLAELIEGEADIAVTEPVVMEVLAVARDDARALDLQRLMDRNRLLRIDPVVDFAAAARIYRTCRRSGVTPRGLLDCVIASVALRRGAVLLTADADLVRVAGVMGIALDPASV
jgi:predicted nucleic acid-binding protein